MATSNSTGQSRLGLAKRAAYETVRFGYNATVRPRLPRKLARYNGYEVHGPRLLDRTGDLPDYEAELIDGLHAVVGEGDDVVIIGGGLGVSTLHAIDKAGPAGSVTTIEAGAKQCELLRQNLRHNQAETEADVRHGYVGAIKQTYSDPGDAEEIDVAALPDADVWILDCEGAERAIVGELTPDDAPERMVVEVHPCYGASVERIYQSLFVLNYEIVEDVEHEGGPPGLRVLTAVREK